MARTLLRSRIPVDLSLVEFDLDSGEQIFLTVCWPRHEGPDIRRTGKGPPVMPLIGGRLGETTTHPFGLRVGTWLIGDDLRQGELQEAERELASARRAGLAPKDFHHIALLAPGLQRAEAALGTLLHEMAHLRNLSLGLLDTDLQTQYHRQEFRDVARLLGLECAPRDPDFGYVRTSLGARAARHRDSAARGGGVRDTAESCNRLKLAEVPTGASWAVRPRRCRRGSWPSPRLGRVWRLEAAADASKRRCQETTMPAHAPARSREQPKDPHSAVALLNAHGANLVYVPHFLDPQQEQHYRARLEAEVEFDSPEASRVFVHGKWREIPRRQTAYGDEGLSYCFSGTRVPARPWVPVVAELRDGMAERTGWPINFVLVNWYESLRRHGVGWHADDERDLDPEAPIASLSLGHPRHFLFRPAARGAAPRTVTITLAPGSLLLMNPPTNRLFQHCLPRRAGADAATTAPRWNLTGRVMKRA